MNDETIPLAPITPDAPANDLTPRPKRITHMHALGMAIAASSRAILPATFMQKKRQRGNGYGVTENCLRKEPPPAVKGQRNKPCPCGSGKKFKHCCIKTKQEKNNAEATNP